MTGVLKPGTDFMYDPEDEELVSRYRWYFDHGYVALSGGRGHVRMHRLMLMPPSGYEVDHINGDRADNRRSNLRVVSHAENLANRTRQNRLNTSGFRGVTFHRAASRCKWQSQAKGRFLGKYVDKTFAAALAATWRAFYMPGATR